MTNLARIGWAVLLAMALNVHQLHAEAPVLHITVFAAPSQSVWIPSLIQSAGLDKAHGFTLEVTQKPGPVAYAEFASGADKVCFCAAPAGVARFVEQGSPITLLWNVFYLDFLVASKNPEIRAALDLRGRKISADTLTGSWAVSSFLLQQQGLAMKDVTVQSSRGAQQIAELAVDRVDAAVFGPSDDGLLQTGSPGVFHTFSIFDRAKWRELTNSPGVPSITMGVWRDWLDDPAHLDLLRRLYAANVDAAAMIRADPEGSASRIAERIKLPAAALAYGFRTYPDIIDIHPSSRDRQAIALLTQKLLPAAQQLERPMTDAELAAYVSDFQP